MPKLKIKNRKAAGGRRKKGKGKGRKKKKGKKVGVGKGPPLHDLTPLYDKLYYELLNLYRQRLIARKKRIEGFEVARESINVKNEEMLYKNHIGDQIEWTAQFVDKLEDAIKKQQEFIQKSIDERLAEMDKRLQALKDKGLDEELQRLLHKLATFDPLAAQLKQVTDEIEWVEQQLPIENLEALIAKMRLRGEFVKARHIMYKRHKKMMVDAKNFARWTFYPMSVRFIQENVDTMECNCHQTKKSNDKGVMLDKTLEALREKSTYLARDLTYSGYQWVFDKIRKETIRLAKEWRLKQQKPKAVREPTEVETDFYIYLSQKLAAMEQAKIRETKRQQAKIRYLQRKLKVQEKENRRKMLLQQQTLRFQPSTLPIMPSKKDSELSLPKFEEEDYVHLVHTPFYRNWKQYMTEEEWKEIIPLYTSFYDDEEFAHLRTQIRKTSYSVQFDKRMERHFEWDDDIYEEGEEHEDEMEDEYETEYEEEEEEEEELEKSFVKSTSDIEIAKSVDSSEEQSVDGTEFTEDVEVEEEWYPYDAKPEDDCQTQLQIENTIIIDVGNEEEPSTKYYVIETDSKKPPSRSLRIDELMEQFNITPIHSQPEFSFN